MKYTEEIFNILSKGGFISSNSVSTQVKRLYDAIEEDLPDYYDYYKGIGFYLEGGDGYYYFTRKESKVDLERKLEAIQKWIDYLSFLKTYHSAFGPGFLFRAADIEIQIGCDIELKEIFGLDDVNQLPIVYNIAWYEQKAVIVLLALLALGVKHIHLGPTLPAFLSPNVKNVLIEQFGIGGISTVDEDIVKFLS